MPTDIDTRRGLDHGAWAPLIVAWPDANVPVLQLSVQTRLGPEHHFRLGQLLAPLREEGEGQWQDWLADDGPLADELLADSEERDQRHTLLVTAMASLNERERDILTQRRLCEAGAGAFQLGRSLLLRGTQACRGADGREQTEQPDAQRGVDVDVPVEPRGDVAVTRRDRHTA